MKKIINKKNIFRILVLLVFTFIIINTYTFANLGDGLNEKILGDVTDENYDTNADVLKPVKKVFSTVYTIFQIIGLGGVVYTGVKYMYAGAEDKAQIKKSLIMVVIGVIFLFAAPAIIDFIAKASKTTLKP